jgi:L-ascorbate metabolism protein UlaG (beta-lactamase superfamily)
VRAPALGFAIEGSQRFYFAGDTALFPGMDGLVPELDVALVPIWGWGPTLGRGQHLDPSDAAQALRLLRPRIAIPIHWGTYRPAHLGLRVLPDFLTDPAARFVEAAAVAAPAVKVHVLRPGEHLEVTSEVSRR